MCDIGLRKELATLIVLGCDEALQNGGWGVTRAAELIGREKSQVSRALKTLAESGLVDRDLSTRNYRLGWKFFVLAARAGEQKLLDVATPVLERLRRNLGETIHLSVLQGVEVVTVLSKPSLRAVTAAERNGRAVPVYCTSSGRVLLFDLDHEAISELLTGVEFRKLGPNTVGDTQELHERVVAARVQGYALVNEEYEPGLVAAASPIRDFRSQVAAALNVSAPKSRFGERLQEAGKEVKGAADELSALLGWSTDLHSIGGATDSSEAS